MLEFSVHGLGDTLGGLQRRAAELGAGSASASLSLAMLSQYMHEEAVFAAYHDFSESETASKPASGTKTP